MRKTIAAEEGPRALWKGLTPALVRQVCYTGLAMVIYEPIRNTITNGSEDPSFFQEAFSRRYGWCVVHHVLQSDRGTEHKFRLQRRASQ